MESKAEFSIVTPISNTNSGLLNIFTKPLIKYDFTRIINYVGRTFGKAGKLLKRNDEDSRISGGLDLSGMRERVAVSAIIITVKIIPLIPLLFCINIKDFKCLKTYSWLWFCARL